MHDLELGGKLSPLQYLTSMLQDYIKQRVCCEVKISHTNAKIKYCDLSPPNQRIQKDLKAKLYSLSSFHLALIEEPEENCWRRTSCSSKCGMRDTKRDLRIATSGTERLTLLVLWVKEANLSTLVYFKAEIQPRISLNLWSWCLSQAILSSWEGKAR